MNKTFEIIDVEIKRLLACNTHLGEYNCEKLMKNYVWRQRKDGIFIIDISKTIEKIKMASRAIVAIKNPDNIISISTSSIGQKGVIGFSRFTGSQLSVGRWIPGKLTNQMCKDYLEPQLIILTNPEIDFRPLNEAAYVNLPTIAFSTTNSSLKFIDIVIPGNNTNRHSVAILWWLLTREVLRLKGVLSKSEEWDVKIETFLDNELLSSD
mmetsp:Transcript_14862/g.35932  ORF Transcript_14862/g.35932 Transcript_14862/m.35932 type:complete len:209 (+) Transcript_14862:36-662(+)